MRLAISQAAVLTLLDTIASVANDDVPSSLRLRAEAVAAAAADQAERVDRDAMFPAAAIAEARRHRLLSAMIPAPLGGDGASLSDLAEICYILGQACASTAMIVAMHTAALACVVRHGQAQHWHRDLLRRVCDEQLLLASSTTEGNAGGNVRSSDAAIVREGERFRFTRAATVMSYGAECDGIVSTARRSAEAAGSDQVAVVLMKDAGCTLAATGGWDTLGMRGTRSSGFALAAEGDAAQILPLGYDRIHPLTMVPVSHIVWAAVWTGIAAAAVTKAQRFVRTAARRAGGTMPPGAGQATRAAATLTALSRMVAGQAAAVDAMGEPELAALSTQAGLNLFKVEASEHAALAVQQALRACGLAGYRNDGEFGIGRHLRDVLSAPVMVHNERILANIGSAALMSGVPTALREGWDAS